MKKKPLLAILLAFFIFAGAASLTGCNFIGGSEGGTEQTQTVSVTGVSLNAKTLEIAVNGTHQLAVNVLPVAATNKLCRWQTSDSAIVTVSSSGLITGKKIGTATVTVTTDDGGKTDTCEVTVRSALANGGEVKVTGITLNPTSMKITEGDVKSITAKVLPSDAKNKAVSWSSSNGDVAQVDGEGQVTAVNAGTATITATTEDGGYTATCSVTVQAPIVNVESVSLNPATLTLTAGESDIIEATVFPDNATNQNVIWSSSDDSVATVDGGIITAVNAGTATITVTTEDGGYTATCSVTVNPSQPVNKYTVTFYDGETAVHSENVPEGETVNYFDGVQKFGYNLIGWTENPDGTGELYDFDSPVTGDTELYAVWTESDADIE